VTNSTRTTLADAGEDVAKTSEDVSLPDPTGKSLAQNQRLVSAIRLPSIAIGNDCRQIGLRQKTHFASRLKQIALFSPPRKNIPLSLYQKL
jgi:hypothetical protein